MTLEQHIKTLNPSIQNQFKNAVQKIQPESIIIGGCAVAHHVNGYRPLTPDLDLLISEDLRDDGLCQLIDSNGRTIGYTDSFTDFLDADVGNIKLNKLILSEFDSMTLFGQELSVIKCELLVILKLSLSRDKDIEDALMLIKSRSFDKERYVGYLDVLKSSLTDYDSLLYFSGLV